MIDWIIAYYNYIVVVILMSIGLWGAISKRNLIKKCIGLSIFQTSIILFYISMGAKADSTIPIIKYEYAKKGSDMIAVYAADYANPLTQILMLTAIVVGVATIGLALTLVQRTYTETGSIHENEILEKLRS